MNGHRVFVARLLIAGLVATFAGATPARTTPRTAVSPADFPQAMRVADRPAFQPAQLQSSRFTEIDAPTVLYTGVSVDAVPPGKRLVVQHLSVALASTAIDSDPVCTAEVRAAVDRSDVVDTRRSATEQAVADAREQAAWSRPITLAEDPVDVVVAHRFPTEREFDGAREQALASLPITLYADTGQRIGVGCIVRVSADTLLSISVTGYYVDRD